MHIIFKQFVKFLPNTFCSEYFLDYFELFIQDIKGHLGFKSTQEYFEWNLLDK